MHPRQVLAGLLGLTFAGLAHAFEFGHARLLSSVGQTLRADIPIVQLSAQELADLQVRVAPEAAWRQAGLTPPVDLSSLQVRVADGLTEGVRIARLTSDQAFTGAVADFLIDVQTVTGVQRHQVSMLAQRHALTLADGVADASSDARPAGIAVRRGDTLFFIAQRHAVAGFTVYQMMAALFYANPRAFIDDNMNLVSAGAVLQLPDVAALSRLTDRQARWLFVQHARSYALRRRQGVTVVTPQSIADSVQSIPSEPPSDDAQAQIAQSPQDQLRLRVAAGEGRTDGDTARVGVGRTDGDARADARMAVRDSLGRIAQLEDNIQDLNQVLQELAQVGAAQTGQTNGAARRRDPVTAVASAAQQNDVQTTIAPVAERGDAAAPLQSTQEQGGSAVAQDGASALVGAGQVGLNAGNVDASSTEQTGQTARIDMRTAASPIAREAEPTISVEPETPRRDVAPSTQPAASGAQQNPALASPLPFAAAPDAKAASPVQSDSVASALFAPDAGSAMAAPVAPARQTTPQTSGAGLPNAMWMMIAAGLALLVLLVVWLLRRARADANDGGKITDAMIQEKLHAIDLDLSQDDPPRRP